MDVVSKLSCGVVQSCMALHAVAFDPALHPWTTCWPRQPRQASRYAFLQHAPSQNAHNHNRARYSGPLYQVNRTLDGALLDVGVLTQGGFANASAQDAFCKATPSPSPNPPPPSPLPPLQSTVYIIPFAEPTYSFRHCDAQGFVTPFDGNLDHLFKLVAALNGDASCVSFQSVNYPAWYIAPIAGAEPGRLGLVQAPKPADASWTIAPSSGGRTGFVVTLPSRNGLAMTVGGNLTGHCAGNYDDGSHSVYVRPLVGS